MKLSINREMQHFDMQINVHDMHIDCPTRNEFIAYIVVVIIMIIMHTSEREKHSNGHEQTFYVLDDDDDNILVQMQ